MTQTEDIDLLLQDAGSLISKYEHLIDRVIQQHIDHGIFMESDYEAVRIEIENRLPNQMLYLYRREGTDVFVKTLLVKATQTVCSYFEDRLLLARKDPEIIIKYTGNLSYHIQRYVHNKVLNISDAEDVAQTVRERLLNKLRQGQLEGFKGDSLFSTFIYRVIDNLIKDAVKSRHTGKAKLDRAEIKHDKADGHSLFSTVSNKLELEKLCKLYRRLLRLLKENDQLKLELCIKIHYHLQLGPEDVAPFGFEEEVELELLNLFGHADADRKESVTWELLNGFINTFENKITSSGNLWKWFVRQRNKIVVKLLFLHFLTDTKVPVVKKMTEKEEFILSKLADRQVSKMADEWLSIVMIEYYEKK